MAQVKGTIKSWIDKSRMVSNRKEQLAYEELINHIKVEESDICDEHPDSEIAKFYQDQSVLLTGGSGFIGKSIIEKLLRSCPNVKEIFVLIRPKRGVDVETRIKLMLHLSLFDRIRNKPNGANLLATKIIPIKGDITMPLLGISVEDLNCLCSRVTTVINSAASVRFDESIEDSTLLNVKSLDNLLEIASKMTKLISFVHISTCYAYCDQRSLEEKFYDSPIDPDELLSLVELSGKPENQNKIGQLLEKTKRPNSYTFTKAVGEALILKRSKKLLPQVAVSIVRPSIVSASWREPLKGWIDNQQAATGIICGLASGSTSIYYSKGHKGADIIPVDLIVSLIITSAWATHQFPDKFPSVTIFNGSSGKFNRVDWKQVVEEFNHLATKFPYDHSIRHPGSLFVSNNILYAILVSIDSFITAKYQFMCDLMGRETKIWIRHKKSLKIYRTLGYFTTREWQFDSSRTNALRNDMSRVDREIFNFSPSEINWRKYFRSYYIGSKVFLFKDSPDKMLASRQRMRSISMVKKISFYMIMTLITTLLVAYLYRGSGAI